MCIRDRGVDVRIVIPQKADADIMQANNGADMRKLIEHGAKVWALSLIHI